MRVVQLISRPQRRGAEVFALDLCRHLEARGHATRIVALYAPPADGAPLALRESDLRLDGGAASRLERLPGWQPRLLRRLAAAVDEFRPDVVQVNGSRTVKYGSLLRRRRRAAGWALVYRSIGTPSDWLRGALRRLLYRRLVMAPVDGVVAVSETTRRDLERLYRLDVPTTVIPRGVDVERFVPYRSRAEVRREVGAGAERPVLLFVGALGPEKRLDRLLRVATAAAERHAAGGGEAPELWVVGDGPERHRLAPPGGALTVRVLGHRDDVAALMAAADLLLLTSDSEGTPGVLLEAAALGVPAVATRVGGVGELVADGATGLLAARDDEAAFADAVAALLGDPEQRRRLGEAAARRVREHFDLPALAERYADHYRRIVERRRAAA